MKYCALIGVLAFGAVASFALPLECEMAAGDHQQTLDLSWAKYPQDTSGKIIVDPDDDGLPNVNLDLFDNDAETCPTDLGPLGDLKLSCNGGNGDFSSHNLGEHGRCKCGTVNNGTHHFPECYRCGIKKVATYLHFKGSRPEKLHCPKMTRRQIIERALGWVVNGAAYMDSTGPETCAQNDPNPNCPQHTFQLVCNGFLDMAWYGGGSDCQYRIDCNDLKPGDKIYRHPHSMLWRKSFFDESGKRTGGLIYQMGGGWAKGNAEHHPNHIEGKCFRRRNLVHDPEFDEGLDFPLAPGELLPEPDF